MFIIIGIPMIKETLNKFSVRDIMPLWEHIGRLSKDKSYLKLQAKTQLNCRSKYNYLDVS